MKHLHSATTKPTENQVQLKLRCKKSKLHSKLHSDTLKWLAMACSGLLRCFFLPGKPAFRGLETPPNDLILNKKGSLFSSLSSGPDGTVSPAKSLLIKSSNCNFPLQGSFSSFLFQFIDTHPQQVDDFILRLQNFSKQIHFATQALQLPGSILRIPYLDRALDDGTVVALPMSYPRFIS